MLCPTVTAAAKRGGEAGQRCSGCDDADVTYPDLPRIPEIPAHRAGEMSVAEVLDQSRGALHAAERALDQLENGAPAIVQLALIRYVVIECRRSTFVLQKLSSRVEGFDEWYESRRQAMSSDPLMRYFRDLRTQIEKEGLPAAMAELVDMASGTTIADVACGEDRHGIWVSGARRPDVAIAAGTYPDAAERMILRNFRLPDPPTTHRGNPITDLRFASLAELAITFLWAEVVNAADDKFRHG
jgi:hypothetical protein